MGEALKKKMAPCSPRHASGKSGIKWSVWMGDHELAARGGSLAELNGGPRSTLYPCYSSNLW